MGTIVETDNFKLDTPALVCRWRLAHTALPLARRHMKALKQRQVDGEPLLPGLIAWTQQHVEWTLEDGAVEYPDGVLMLVVDKQGQALMSIGPYMPLQDVSSAALAERAQDAYAESEATGVAPESLWIYEEKRQTCTVYLPDGAVCSAAGGVLYDLCMTLGIRIVFNRDILPVDAVKAPGLAGIALVSDEHGVVCSSTCTCATLNRLAEGFKRLYI